MLTDVMKTDFISFIIWKKEVSPHKRNRQPIKQSTKQKKQQQKKTNKQKTTKKQVISCPKLLWKIATIRQNIAQMTFTTKAYIPCHFLYDHMRQMSTLL